MPNPAPSRLLQPDSAALLLVDIQEKFVPVLDDCERLLDRSRILIQGCRQLDIPVVVSEQYPQGLGRTVDTLTEVLPDNAAFFEKTAFGCGLDSDIPAFLAGLNRSQIIVCGIEAHICVNQTVHQLLAEGYQVHLMQDAVTSRHKKDAKTALTKMRQSGAIPSCVEMALFELMGSSKHPCFKPIQALVK